MWKNLESYNPIMGQVDIAIGYCDGPCDWWEPTMLMFYGMVALFVIIPVAVIYGLFRLNRWLREGDEQQARRG